MKKNRRNKKIIKLNILSEWKKNQRKNVLVNEKQWDK